MLNLKIDENILQKEIFQNLGNTTFFAPQQKLDLQDTDILIIRSVTKINTKLFNAAMIP